MANPQLPKPIPETGSAGSSMMTAAPGFAIATIPTCLDGIPTSIVTFCTRGWKAFPFPSGDRPARISSRGPSRKQFWRPGPAEAAKAFKGNAAFLYEGLYLGFLWVFERPEKKADQKADAELVFSRDGIRWQRLFPGDYFLPRGAAGTWDCEGVLPVAPVVHDDRIWIYYSGWNHPYSGKSLGPVQNGWIENGQRKQGAIGLATLRLDGFVSFDAGEEGGTLTTKDLKPSGSLVVNADVRGELRVELLDAEGKVMRGYSAAECQPIRSDGLRHVVQWEGGAGFEFLSGRLVRLGFQLRDASLYAFSFRERP
ncbi:MAG: hypothetical protein ACREIA_07735 [Opitutaceae bacterium]